jgi:putative ABC transport system permease protein
VSILDALRLALQQIRVQKLKSFFTVTGVTIGVMFLIAVISVVEGLNRYMVHDFIGKLMAVNSFELRHHPYMNFGDVTEAQWNEWNHRPRIKEDDLHPVIDALPSGARWYMMSQDNLAIESQYARPQHVQVDAVTGDYFDIKKLGVVEGRVFTGQELETGALVVVIGKDVKEHFFRTVDPVGRWLRMGGVPYTVVGVAEPQGSTFGVSLDKFIIAPYRSPVHRLLNRERGVIDGIVVQATNQQILTDAMGRVRQVMRVRHKLHPSQPDNFSLTTPESSLTLWQKIKVYLRFAGLVLPTIGLVVGAIVIMNIMLVAVAERTREIGVRKALGARRRDIMVQFLIESTALSLIGAAIGIGLGATLADVVSKVSPLPVDLVPWSIAVAVAVGGVIGIVAAVYPAMRAARLDPIAALRQE